MSVAAAGAIIGALGSVPQIMETAMQNRQNRKFALDMYERQKTDALDFWNQQNAYNSPEQQMQRFEKAGLNPNLVYSRGDAGNASAPNLPAFDRPNWERIGFDQGANQLSTILDLQTKKQNLDNMVVQNGILKEEQAIRTVRALRGQFDYDFAVDLADADADFRRERARNLKQQTLYSMNENDRRNLYGAIAKQMAIERMTSMQLDRQKTELDMKRIDEAIRLMKKDGNLKDFEISLNQSGLTRTDELWARLMGLGIKKAGFRLH